MRLVTVAVPVPLRQRFDYEAPDALVAALVPGVRVWVPFGRRELVGVVVDAVREVEVPEFEPRPITSVLDDVALTGPMVGPELLALCRWVADYYLHPLGEVIAAALPGPLRRGEPVTMPPPDGLQLTEAGRVAMASLPARSTTMKALLDRLASAPGSSAQVRAALPSAAAALKKALDSGWVERCALDVVTPLEARLPLTEEQAAALTTLDAGLSAGFAVSLLEGVTGSGKTELYLRLTETVLATGGQVLVLAPEIGLTPQLVARFKARFGDGVASFHSGLSETERARNWLAARDGRARIVVGTRSAVFVPMARLALVIVDEEHDVSYKQQDGLRYQARDVAVLRARRAGAPVLLGSATPSLESLHNAETGRYRHLRLLKRVRQQAPPRIHLLDVRHAPLDNGLSPTMIEAVSRQLEAGHQALLFLNRRGYAPVLLCHDCGAVTPCPNCDARLVVHRARKRLACHHCGHVEPIPPACSDCGGKLVPVGQGTERIEDALRMRFPEYRVERFDSDRLSSGAAIARLLADVERGDVKLLVGTQVLAKGHDFAGLAFAGLIDVDQALFGSDFRAIERMGQMVTQVAGRVGRADAPGEVLLQTHQPEHPLLRLLVERGYPAFAATLMAERKQFGLPPFASLALLRVEARSEGEVMNFLRTLRSQLPAADEVEILGPAPATMARRAGYQRGQLLLKSPSRSALHRLLGVWLPEIEALGQKTRLRWSLDVDPADLF
ncbi:primosomal protein N' [Nevskia ramosa]|uniref:primosomal protein N' n=1 Tax=Nevskia ramosa TaxID=64002 RepID=UPI0003B6932C|nr:primosomal protein N' [Nevskia ramosa]